MMSKSLHIAASKDGPVSPCHIQLENDLITAVSPALEGGPALALFGDAYADATLAPHELPLLAAECRRLAPGLSPAVATWLLAIAALTESAAAAGLWLLALPD